MFDSKRFYSIRGIMYHVFMGYKATVYSLHTCISVLYCLVVDNSMVLCTHKYIIYVYEKRQTNRAIYNRQ